MDRVELLSPARDLETGLAAVNCGADAVYIGATRFGAREAAGNPLDAIEALIAYAHKYWASVYVVVNTLLYDEELPAAERLIRQLYEMGADALIIQDTGLLELDLPPIPLFASTQMHNHTAERISFLEKVGIQRVILARELSLDQIHEIRAATSLELESFIHGALCVSYSGQCYLSYALGGRSGNRGQCAQPCRRPYRLVDATGQTVEETRHLLSLRDLNLSDHLRDLLDAGVRSFKIEGRLKDKAYVMNVVGHYRRLLDDILSGHPTLRPSSSGRVQLDFTPNPFKTFNRSATTYFLYGKGAPLAAWDTPKSLGEPLGRVTHLTRRSFTLDFPGEIHPGDGLCFFDASRELRGTTVNEVQGKAIFPAKMEGLSVGTMVYRNHDHVFMTALNKSQSARKIGVNFRLETAPEGLTLLACCEDGIEAQFTLPCALTPAEKPETARATLERQLSKLGGTSFTCLGVEIALPQFPFVPLSAINALRRGALEALEREREAHRPRRTGQILKNDIPFPQRELSFEGNVLNRLAANFYRRHGVTRIEPAAESGLDLRGRKVMTTRYCIKYQLGACPKEKARQTPLALHEPLTLVDEDGTRLPLRFNCARCEMEVYYQEGPHEPARIARS